VITWQVREKHDNDLRAVMQRLGYLNKRGGVMRFNGAEFWPALAAAGHTSTQLDDCACARRPYSQTGD
jgi:hypothetical protein